MKKIFRIISLVCIAGMLSGCGLISESDKAIKEKELKNSIVTVNGENVAKDIFYYYFYDAQDKLLQEAGISSADEIPDDFWTKKTDGKTALETAKENALSDMVNDYLQYQKAKEEGITLSANEKSYIQSQVSQIKQDQNMLSQLAQMGVDVDYYEELITQSAYIQKLVSKYVDEGKIKIDESKVFEELGNNYIKAKHILISTVDTNTRQSLSDEEITEKHAILDEVMAQLKAGGDFDELMQQYSEDPGLSSAPDGYVFTSGDMVQEFEDAAYALKEGEVSGVVKSSYGYHIIKREPLDPNGTQEQQYMENFEYNSAIPELKKLTKKWKESAEIKPNKEVLNSIEPTITQNSK